MKIIERKIYVIATGEQRDKMREFVLSHPLLINCIEILLSLIGLVSARLYARTDLVRYKVFAILCLIPTLPYSMIGNMLLIKILNGGHNEPVRLVALLITIVYACIFYNIWQDTISRHIDSDSVLYRLVYASSVFTLYSALLLIIGYRYYI